MEWGISPLEELELLATPWSMPGGTGQEQISLVLRFCVKTWALNAGAGMIFQATLFCRFCRAVVVKSYHRT